VKLYINGIFVRNKREIMKHVLKMQCISLFPIYIRRTSRCVFLYAFAYKCKSLKVKLHIKCRTINVVSTVSTRTYTALWTGRNKHLQVQGSRDNNKQALVVHVEEMRDMHYLKLKIQQLTKLW
jgi:hypothetical protein